MIEKAKKHKKGLIREEDISTLFQRYTATTVLALLQEVAQVQDVKIDWNALVKKTSTGISNAREYQMLWRHLAYRHVLTEKLGDGTEPLGDDSDLEYDLEACPAVTSEASTEAAACVKVLIASGLPSDSSLPNSSTVEAPLTINIPNGQSSGAHMEKLQQAGSLRGTNITVPVSVQKQPLAAPTPAEGLDAHGSASSSMPPRKRRKPWSAAEDMELIAAVQKCGEGNWANILKGDFKGDRTASQLSQRWAIIRRRHGKLNAGAANLTGSQISDAQRAARHAMNVALNGNLKTPFSVAGTSSNNVSSNFAFPLAHAEVGSGTTQTQNQSQQGLTGMSSQLGTLDSATKSQLPLKKMSGKSAISSHSMVKAAAVAAGARIATPEDAASLLKAAQAKNAVHIMPGGGSLIKSSVSGGAVPSSSSHLGGHHNVHVSTGLAATPLSTYSAVAPNASRLGSGKAVVPAVQSIASSISSEQTNTATSIVTVEFQSKQESKTSEEIEVRNSVNAPKEQAQEDQPCLSTNPTNQPLQEALPISEAIFESQLAVVHEPKEHCREDQAFGSDSALSQQVQVHQGASLVPEEIIRKPLLLDDNSTSLNIEAADNDQAISAANLTVESQNLSDVKMEDPKVEGGEDHPAVEQHENQTMNEKQGAKTALKEQRDYQSMNEKCGDDQSAVKDHENQSMNERVGDSIGNEDGRSDKMELSNEVVATTEL